MKSFLYKGYSTHLATTIANIANEWINVDYLVYSNQLGAIKTETYYLPKGQVIKITSYYNIYFGLVFESLEDYQAHKKAKQPIAPNLSWFSQFDQQLKDCSN